VTTRDWFQNGRKVYYHLLGFLSLGCSTSTNDHSSEEAPSWETLSGRSTAMSSTPEGRWSQTGHMAMGRLLHTATLLPDGLLLATGGYNRSTELYDAATGT
jgi:hypothetical protein